MNRQKCGVSVTYLMTVRNPLEFQYIRLRTKIRSVNKIIRSRKCKGITKFQSNSKGILSKDAKINPNTTWISNYIPLNYRCLKLSKSGDCII